MIPLDHLERIIAKMKEPNATDVLTANEKEKWALLSDDAKIEALENIVSSPVGCHKPPWAVVSWFFKTRWLEALQAVNLTAPASMLELASGATDMLPKILAKFYHHPETSYTTANLNKELTAQFKNSTKDLPIKIDVIEDAAQTIENHFGDRKVDVVVFEHAFNDIVEDMIAVKNGIDTIDINWMDILPQLIKATNDAYLNGTYETIIKEEFLQMLKSLIKILKPGSFIISHQFQYQLDLDLGIIPEIWSDLISTVREWIKEENIGKEVFIDGFEPNWWMFIQNV